MKNISNLMLKSFFLSALLGSTLSAQTLSDALGEGGNLDLRVGVDGEVAEVLVESGQRVEKGQLLIKLNTERYQSRIDAASAVLQSAKFRLRLNEEDFARQQALFDEGSLSTVELQMFEFKTIQAKAEMMTARANYQSAKRDLAGAQILAPVPGEVVAVPLIGQRANIQSGVDVLIKMKAK